MLKQKNNFIYTIRTWQQYTWGPTERLEVSEIVKAQSDFDSFVVAIIIIVCLIIIGYGRMILEKEAATEATSNKTCKIYSL